MEYTEQEIEMLARFDIARYDADDWATCSDEAKAKDRRAILSALTGDNCPAVLRAATRLMREAQSHVTIDVKRDGEIRMTTGALDVLLREAREQGAAEMRERATAVAHDPIYEASIDASSIAARISILSITVPS